MAGPLLRPRYNRKIGGVCAAFARAYGWDLTMVRLVVVLLVIFGGSGVLAYIICWIVIPEDPVGLPYPQQQPFPGQQPYAGQPPYGQPPYGTQPPPPPPGQPPVA